MDSFENDYAVRIKDFSKMFGLSDSTPYDLIKRYPDKFKTIKKGRHTYIPATAVQYYLNNNRRKEKADCQAIACYMRKGGVGKTTVLLNLAVRSCMHGNKVLLIDFDSQANCTRSFKVENPKARPTFSSIFEEEIDIKDAIVHVRKNLHIIPANNKLTKLASNIDPMKGFRQFEPFINKVRSEYDLIFIDCGGLMDMTTFQALVAADKIISPAFPDEYSDEGLELTIEEIKKIEHQGIEKKHYIVLNKIDPSFRERATKEYVTLFKDLYSNIAKTKIRRSQDLVNSISEGNSIFEYQYDSKVAEEIENLYQEIILENFTKNEIPQ